MTTTNNYIVVTFIYLVITSISPYIVLKEQK